MSDPLASVNAGATSPFIARRDTINGVLEAVRRLRRNERGQSGASPEVDPGPAAASVWVRSSSGAALAIRSVVTPAGVGINPTGSPITAQRQPTFAVTAPATDSDTVLILSEPAAASESPGGTGGLASAVVSGVTVASVVVSDVTHQYARPVPDDSTALASAETGQVRLLQTFAEPGTYLCYVLLQGAGGGSGDGSEGGCEGTDWTLAVEPGDCIRVSVVSELPAPDPLPVTDCEECPDGAPESYTFTLTGGTGDFADANGVWTVTHTTGCEWVGAMGEYTATLVANGASTLEFEGPGGYLMRFVRSGPAWACSGPNATEEDDASGGTGTPPDPPTLTAVPPAEPVTELTLTSTDGGDTFTSATATALEICGVAYAVTFDPGEETLTLTGPETSGGSAVVFEGKLACGGCNYAVFGFRRKQLCPCEPVADGGACANVIRLRVEWVPCHEQAYDVEVPCCPGVLLPRVVCVRGSPLAGLGGLADGQATRILLWNPDAGPVGAWQGRGRDGLGNPCVLDLRCTDVGVGAPDLIWLLTAEPSCSVGGAVGSNNDFALGRKSIGDTTCPESGADFGVTLDIEGPEWAPIADNWTVTAWTPAGCEAPSGVPGYTAPGWYVTASGVLYLDDALACDPRYVIRCGPYDTEEEADAAALSGLCGGGGDIEPCEVGELLEGWAGPGWYCVRDYPAVDPACEAVYLAHADRCDLTIELCSGPYASESVAATACAGGGGSGYGGPFECPDGSIPSDGTYCSRVYGTTEDPGIHFHTTAACNWEIVSGPHDPPETAPCFGSSGGGGGPTTGAEIYDISLPGGGSGVVYRHGPRRWQGGGWLLTAQTGGAAWLLTNASMGCRWRADSWTGAGCKDFAPLNTETGCTDTVNVCVG